jgi:hypothetical protein
MQKKCIKVGFFVLFLYKYSLKTAFLAGFGEKFGEKLMGLLSFLKL